MRTIISILSDQPIPNVLFIKEMASAQDRHIFISTAEMEEKHKSETLAAALELKKKQFAVLKIDPHNAVLIKQALIDYGWPVTDEFMVNITGGTKMMSQMVLVHFSKLSNTTIFYWPVTNRHLQQLHPVIEEKVIPFPFELDLKTYFLALGYDYMAQVAFSFPFEMAEFLLKESIRVGHPGRVNQLKDACAQTYLKPDKNYLTGRWFEEWLYGFLKETLQLPDNHIGYNVKIKNNYSKKKSDSDNELDVVFIYENRLYLWECKVYTSGEYVTGRKITDPIYKIASVTQSLGLQASSFVVIFSKLSKDQQQIDFLEDITRLMRIRTVFSFDDLTDLNLFQSTLFKLIDYGT